MRARTKEQRLTHDIEAGRSIARLMEEPAVKAWLDAEQRRIIEQMIARPVSDDDGRRADALMLKAVRSFKTAMSELAGAARRAEKTISEGKHGTF